MGFFEGSFKGSFNGSFRGIRCFGVEGFEFVGCQASCGLWLQSFGVSGCFGALGPCGVSKPRSLTVGG